MLKRNSKALAIVLALSFCLAFVAPAFVVPDAAEAAAVYTGMTAPTYGTSDDDVDLGVISVEFTSGAEIASGDVLTVSFPSGVTARRNDSLLTSDTTVSGTCATVVVPTTNPQTNMPNGLISAMQFNGNLAASPSVALGGTLQSLNVTFAAAGTFNRGILYIYLNGMDLNGASGDLTATIMGSSANIPMGSVVIGKISSSSGTAVSMKSVKPIGTSATALDVFTMIETSNNSLVSNETVKIKLPVGFEWTAITAVQPNWAFNNTTARNWTVQAAINADTRILDIKVPNVGTGKTQTGRFDVIASIQADDSVAKKGDVVAHVYSDMGHVTEADVTVANYGTYAANAAEGTVNELMAGKSEQKLGTFYVKEELPGSLVSGRTIKLTLPDGVKWWGGYRTANGAPTVTVDQGDANVKPFTVSANSNNSSDEGRSISCTVNAQSTGTKGGILKFKDFKVDVSPEFTGPVKVTVSGTSGATGEAKVADVIAPITASVDTMAKIRIGEQKQAAGTLVIKEAKKDMIAYRNTAEWVDDDATAPKTAAANGRTITLTLSDAGARWASLPTVKVTEGDLQLNLNAMAKATNVLTIPVKSSSMTASTIEISDILLTLDRTVPEGALKVTVAGLAVDELENVFPNDDLADFVLCDVVTPAPDEGTTGAATGEFKIGSNIYEINGVAKVMDAAPYIKNGRTYMPIRFLGYAMGLTDDDIVWDEATQKVTMTKGDKVVELTVGSTTITVNGEAQTMDVAPEISNGRTMLPARYVAEGLGYVVGWDAATQTVLISK